MLSQKRLKESVRYDPDSGEFISISDRRRWKKGRICGSLGLNGYKTISIDGERNYSHRLAFLYMQGKMPDIVDHINGDRSDNRWSNLRAANTNENTFNSSIPSNNTSGIKGIHWDKKNKKWQVGLGVNGKKIHFGRWDDLEAAELVMVLAREKYHGEFANNG